VTNTAVAAVAARVRVNFDGNEQGKKARKWVFLRSTIQEQSLGLGICLP